jgi:hypothetical protein
MRTEPFSAHDRAIIIQHLAQHGTWDGSRAGVSIRLVRYTTAAGESVQYAVSVPRNRNDETSRPAFSDRADTVALALEACNRLIMGWSIHGSTVKRPASGAPALPPSIPARRPNELQWLPYKDA